MVAFHITPAIVLGVGRVKAAYSGCIRPRNLLAALSGSAPVTALLCSRLRPRILQAALPDLAPVDIASGRGLHAAVFYTFQHCLVVRPFGLGKPPEKLRVLQYLAVHGIVAYGLKFSGDDFRLRILPEIQAVPRGTEPAGACFVRHDDRFRIAVRNRRLPCICRSLRRIILRIFPEDFRRGDGAGIHDPAGQDHHAGRLHHRR